MLFKQKILQQIVKGNITKAFRVWKKPSVKTGGTLLTSAGLLEIVEVKSILKTTINQNELRDAGISETDLEEQLKREGDLYRIIFRYGSEDPRIKLQNELITTHNDFASLQNKLIKIDNGKFGPWTSTILKLIQQNPETLAQILADEMRVEKIWFKSQVRRLKKLGLTISLGIGYKLSPRSESYLKMQSAIKL